MVTGVDVDCFKFKVLILCNVVLMYFYFYDGEVVMFKDVVDIMGCL